MMTRDMGMRLAALLACASVVFGADADTGKPAEPSRLDVLTRRVAALQKAQAAEGPALQERAKTIQADLDRLEADIAKSGNKPTAEQTKRRNELKAQLQAVRDKRHNQLAALEAAGEELELLKIGQRTAERLAAFEAAMRDGTL